jgi:riboflavin biosynthesis pyrimidine reductase
MQMIDQVFPVKRQVPLEGLYLGEKLLEMATQIGRSLVLTNYVTDKNGVIAKAAKDTHFAVPAELKNSSDWDRYQELLAQADVMISSGAYFKRLSTSQDVLYQFEPGHAFERLGQWRLDAGYEKRSPDVAIVSRHLDFEIPEELRRGGRKIAIFTTDAMATSDEARALSNADTTVIGSGEAGVDGGRMIATLAEDIGYRVIMMVSGPQILDLLLRANRLDRIYITEVQTEIPFDNASSVQTVLSGGKKVIDLQEFQLAHQFVQDNVVTENGSHVSQSFLRYDARSLRG